MKNQPETSSSADQSASSRIGRREFLKTGVRLGLATSALALPNLALGQPARPNILMIPIDDLNDWVSPLGGYSLVQTPNIARLAGMGCVYRNAQSNVPACSPSRAATMFGLQPYFTGVYTNKEEWQRTSFFNSYASLPRHFKNNGYFTVGTGKIFHDNEEEIIARIDPPAWDDYQFCGPTDECRIQVVGDFEGPVAGGSTVELSQYAKTKSGVSEFDFGPYYQLHQVPDVVRSTWMAQNVLRVTHSKPLFAACGMVKPHLPAIVPQSLFNLYPQSSLFYPPGVLDSTHHSKTTNQDTLDLGTTGKRINTFLADHTRLIQTGEWKSIIRAYLASISLADHCVGLLLDALLNGPNAGNTVIVLWSDHGFQLGEKLAWRKFTLWERALRVPFIFAGPGIAVANRTMPASLIDLYRHRPRTSARQITESKPAERHEHPQPHHIHVARGGQYLERRAALLDPNLNASLHQVPVRRERALRSPRRSLRVRESVLRRRDNGGPAARHLAGGAHPPATVRPATRRGRDCADGRAGRLERVRRAINTC